MLSNSLSGNSMSNRAVNWQQAVHRAIYSIQARSGRYCMCAACAQECVAEGVRTQAKQAAEDLLEAELRADSRRDVAVDRPRAHVRQPAQDRHPLARRPRQRRQGLPLRAVVHVHKAGRQRLLCIVAYSHLRAGSQPVVRSAASHTSRTQ